MSKLHGLFPKASFSIDGRIKTEQLQLKWMGMLTRILPVWVNKTSKVYLLALGWDSNLSYLPFLWEFWESFLINVDRRWKSYWTACQINNRLEHVSKTWQSLHGLEWMFTNVIWQISLAGYWVWVVCLIISVSFKLFTLCSEVIWNFHCSLFSEDIRYGLTKPRRFTLWFCCSNTEQAISLNLWLL